MVVQYPGHVQQFAILSLPPVAVGEEGTEVTGVEVTPVVTPLGGTLGGALPARAEPLAEGEVADPLPLVPPQVSHAPHYRL